jgi:hypothetical protein
MSAPPITGSLNAGNEASMNPTQEASSLTPHEKSTSPPTKEITPPYSHSKPCFLRQRPRDVLIRCRVDETKRWVFVCTSKCWREVSGGRPDGVNEHPLFRYGGMWRYKHEVASVKVKGKGK